MKLLEGRTLLALWLLLAGAAALTLYVGQATNIDLALADAVFDRAANDFPLRHAWLTETFNHGVLKGFAIVAAVACISRMVVDLLMRNSARDPLARVRLRIVGLSALLVPFLTSLLKFYSASHCPWDLARYGGNQPYLRLLDLAPPGWELGHCLPAGHASSTLWLMALAVYWLPDQPRKAGLFAAGALAFGTASGILQQLRGAHFLTHTLWSVWIASAVVLGLVTLWQAFSHPAQIALPWRDA